MLYNEPSPLEVKILTRRFGLENSRSLDTYLANEGYAGGHEMGLRAPQLAKADLHRGERR